MALADAGLTDAATTPEESTNAPTEPTEAAEYCRNVVIASMNAIRASADRLEELTAKDYWPFPTYSDLLFY